MSMSGIRRCAKCSKLMKVRNAGPKPMRLGGTFPQHICEACKAVPLETAPPVKPVKNP